MPHVLSYRLGNVLSPQLALDRVARIGIRYLEISMPPEQTVAQVKEALEPHGLKVSTLQCHPTPLDDDVLFETVERCCAAAQELGAVGLFTSTKAGDTPLEEAYARLSKAGDIAAAHGLFIAMETHQDLCENGGKANETLSTVNHPAVGWNLDTANIYYYNENVDVVEEARKGARWVRSVHTKDTTGGYKSADFPCLGQGIVDYAAVVAVLEAAGFTGPLTMELEGTAASAPDADGLEANVRACADHLRGLGLAE